MPVAAWPSWTGTCSGSAEPVVPLTPNLESSANWRRYHLYFAQSVPFVDCTDSAGTFVRYHVEAQHTRRWSAQLRAPLLSHRQCVLKKISEDRMRAGQPTRTMRKSVSPLTGETLRPVKTRIRSHAPGSLALNPRMALGGQRRSVFFVRSIRGFARHDPNLKPNYGSHPPANLSRRA